MPTPTPIVTWELNVPTEYPAAQTETIVDPNHSNSESILGVDVRELVDPVNFEDGGKYRSIVKIQGKFTNPNGSSDGVWMMSTGWLIRPDLVVTAGHVVYEKGFGFGQVTDIQCYIGYNGVGSVPKQSDGETTTKCQPRYGRKVATPEAWIESGDRLRDIAFIQVHKPFTGNLNLFKYTDTPTTATQRVGVVGYPGDKELHIPGKEPEKGAQMYELFETTHYDLKAQPRHMVAYGISTFGGQSGAPVLQKIPPFSQLVAIGTHCYGAGDGETKNSGNPIGGEWGNNYASLIAEFGPQDGVATDPHNISMPTPTTGAVHSTRRLARAPAVPGPAQAPFIDNPPLTAADDRVDEGFLDILKKVAQVGAAVLPIGGALLGPVGSTVGTVAGALLGSVVDAGRESEFAEPNAVARLADSGAAERAVLAEASLEAVLSLFDHNDTQDPVVNNLLARMSHNYTANAANVDDLAKAFAPQLTECALDIATQQLARAKASKTGGSQETTPSTVTRKPLTGIPKGTAEAVALEDAFTKGLLSDTIPLPGAEEGAFDFLGPLLKKAVDVGIPLVTQAAKDVVTKVTPAILNQFTGGSKTEGAIATTLSENIKDSKILFQRALVGDAALTALQSLTSEQLGALKVRRSSKSQESTTSQAEGIFDFIKTTVQQIGPFALDVGKKLVLDAAPILLKAATDGLKNTLALPNGGEAAQIKRQPSHLELYRAAVHTPVKTLRKESNPDAPVIMSGPPPNFRP